ncbi:hypothetical protein Misp01_42980 [Microtetraspora sp. NBRC 13810]|uniref:peptidase inhibitor family I36 protein n=1 Tax=Microtetraspora sp. NBRC 13810 TaxID=3030990 RepID=UPI0024A53C8D|nr:peptidase inhibitor family I36 protein [Microtetraspora sp. NBRC 13810]GLW09169.1 hypothetical protein Misp01_42980 [Microtetraspora sp. NBRC 13810]
MRRKIMFSAGVLALGLGAGAPAVAAEATGADNLAARSLYVYEHDDFKGRWSLLTANDDNFLNNYWSDSSGNISDNISSFRNTGDQRAVMYSDVRYSGAAYTALAHSSDRDLTSNSNNPSNFDNVASSVRFVI